MGPLEYAIFRFPGNEFNGEILPALGRLVDSGTIAVLDLLFITKDADGKSAWVELQDIPGDGAGLMAVTGGRCSARRMRRSSPTASRQIARRRC